MELCSNKYSEHSNADYLSCSTVTFLAGCPSDTTIEGESLLW